MNRFVRFNFTKDTAVAFGAGAVMIFLSLIMLLFGGDSLIDKAMSFILRDLLMIFGLGIVFCFALCLEKGRKHKSPWLYRPKKNPESFA